MANITNIQLQKIEQGRFAHIEPKLIHNLAIALNLPTLARQIFFSLSQSLSVEEYINSLFTADKLLSRNIETLSQLQTHALLVDDFGNIVAGNPAMFEVLGVEVSQISNPDLLSQYNLFRLICAPEFGNFRKMLGNNSDTLISRMITWFKMTSIKSRTNPNILQLLPELNHLPLFRKEWQSPFTQDDEFPDNIPVSIKHPKYVYLDLMIMPQITLSDFGDLHIYNFVAVNDQTAEACLKIFKHVGSEIVLLSPWPKEAARR